MKQNINSQQLNELTESQLDNFSKWIISKGYVGFLKIGQIIEFLGEDWFTDLFYGDWDGSVNKDHTNESLCDDLWEAMKEKL